MKHALTHHTNNAEIKRALDALHHNQCPQCGTPIERKERHGQYVYVLPCGHQSFHGKA